MTEVEALRDAVFQVLGGEEHPPALDHLTSTSGREAADGLRALARWMRQERPQERWACAARSLPYAVVRCTMDGVIGAMNEAAEHFFGPWALGAPWADIATACLEDPTAPLPSVPGPPTRLVMLDRAGFPTPVDVMITVIPGDPPELLVCLTPARPDPHAGPVQDRRREEEDRARFLEAVSHEIRTPLHAIVGLATTLASEPGADPSLSDLRRSAEQLMHIVNRRVDFTKLEANQAESPRPTPTWTEPSKPATAEPVTVLVVDDQAINRTVAAKMVQRLGGRVVEAPGGAAAVEMVRSRSISFDLVLMDCLMPDVDGLEATRQIRAFVPWSELPIVALTASGLPNQRAECLAAGMNDFVAKPLTLDLLRGILDRYATARRSGRAA
jgi:CheY-like chemotaxis protein